MKNVVRLMMLSLALFLAQQGIGYASAIQAGDQMISANLGAVIPVNSVDFGSVEIDYGKTGFGLGAQYQYFLTDNFAFGAEFDQNWFSTKQQYGIKVRGRSSNFLFTGRYNLLNQDGLRLYIPAGLGAARMRVDIDEEHAYATGFMWNIGLGFETEIQENISIGVETKYNQAYWKKYDIDDTINYVSVMFKVSRRF
ncbi:MAG: porin family protein [Campylobacter sp.]|nr:porin family protein [Campylobacter sp.]